MATLHGTCNIVQCDLPPKGQLHQDAVAAALTSKAPTLPVAMGVPVTAATAATVAPGTPTAVGTPVAQTQTAQTQASAPGAERKTMESDEAAEIFDMFLIFNIKQLQLLLHTGLKNQYLQQSSDVLRILKVINQDISI